MSDLLKKLQYKGQKEVFVINCPEDVVIPFEATVDVKTSIYTSSLDFLLAFLTTADEIKLLADSIQGKLVEDPSLWFAYPKKSSKKYKSEINRDFGWQPLGDIGLEGVRQVAIDEDWSALRFRPASKIKTMSRSGKMAMSKEGKKRTKDNG